MRKLTFLAAVALTPLISACTTSQVYESLQDHGRDQCSKMADVDRSACLSRSSGDYNSYKKQRDQAAGARSN
jgi:hypothetical protein